MDHNNGISHTWNRIDRGSARVGVKAFSAASVAVGIAMWAVALMTAPASQSGGATPASTVEVTQSR